MLWFGPLEWPSQEAGCTSAVGGLSGVRIGVGGLSEVVTGRWSWCNERAAERAEELRVNGHRTAARSDRYPPALHHRGRSPLRRGRLGTEGRPDHELPRWHGRLRAARCRGAGVLEYERHEHPRSEV